MRFHIIGLPHTKTSNEYNACAFTIKIRRFIQMMTSLGHTCYHYGAEGSDVNCEHVTVMTNAEQVKYFGEHNPNKLYSLDWSGKAEYWHLFNTRVIAEINKRADRGDFVGVIFGTLQKPITDQLSKNLMVVEYGIGYNGTYAPYRVFESYSHMHKILGAQQGFNCDGNFYDTVIPNYLDPNEYRPCFNKDDYYLYLGRLISRKGINIAVETCKHLDAPLVVAGQGAVSFDGRKLVCEDGGIYEYDKLDFLGVANVKTRGKLLKHAKAVFVPTIYVEPFGTVAVEAQMAGTPVITTDWGAFTENVRHGLTGYRCRTLKQFIQAAKDVEKLDCYAINMEAQRKYSMWAIRYQYEEYFKSLQDLWEDGWYTV